MPSSFQPDHHPDDDELMPLVSGHDAEECVLVHVEDCPQCQRRLHELKQEILQLQAAWKTTNEIANQSTDQGERKSKPKDVGYPARIGRYFVVIKLDGGGQGEVFRVIHPTLAIDLILKLSWKQVDPTNPVRNRLVAEGRHLAQLDNPNVARVVDLDFYEDRAFLVMEYVRGRNLRQQIGKQRLPPIEAATLMAKVARALAPVHAMGIIHQDLKPENVVIDVEGRPRIIDFGLAMVRDAWNDDAKDDDLISGSIPYMSPEQASGDHREVDRHSDIFSLGAMLYELLTGNAPYAGKQFRESLQRAQACEFDQQALLAPEIPRGLANVCLKAMSKEPSKRQASVEELATELTSCTGTTSPFPIAIAIAIAIASIVVVGLLFFLMVKPKMLPQPPPPKFQEELVTVEREGGFHSLLELTQLRADDKYVVHCDIPPGFKAALFWLGSSGQLQQIPPHDIRESNSSAGTRLAFPRESSIEMAGGSSTELIFVCAAPGKSPEFQQVANDIRDLGLLAPWPTLAPRARVLLHQERVETRTVSPLGKTRDPGLQINNSSADVENRMERLRAKLHERYPFVVGIAFPHD